MIGFGINARIWARNALVIVLLIVSLNAQEFAGGAGTLGSPWQIATAIHLNNVRNYLGDAHTDKYFILNNDILNLKDDYSNWVTIGNSSNAFKGHFDGNNRKITGLKIDRATTDDIGLFGALGAEGNIENLGVETDVSSSVKGQNFVAVVVGRNSGGIISNCYSTGAVIGNVVVGGLVGGDYGGTIQNSHSSASVTGNSIYQTSVGGLVGSIQGSVSNCYATGNVTGSGSNVGGLVGTVGSSASISGSYATGNVSGNSKSGGLVGVIDAAGGSVTNSHAEGNATTTLSWSGGLVGGNYGTISNSYATGSATGSTSVGGLVGNNWNTVSRCYALGAVFGKESLGGLVGKNDSGNIQNCYSKGNVTCTTYTYPYFGGFVGFNYQGKTLNCYSTGWVKINTSLQTTKGFCGLITTGGIYEMSGNFWDAEASGMTTTAGTATGKTTAEMKTLATFTDAGWDFEGETANGTDNYWDLSVSVNDGYPYLAWQDGEDISLPVELSAFRVEQVLKTVKLSWITDSEFENLGFIIERKSASSLDQPTPYGYDQAGGAQDAAIVEVASYLSHEGLVGQGSSNEAHQYNFVDTDIHQGGEYIYYLHDVDYQGQQTLLDSVQILIEDQEWLRIPDEFSFGNVYPNPFNPRISLPFALPEAAEIRITVYDIRGREVLTLASSNYAAGRHTLVWNGTNALGRKAASGVYILSCSVQGLESDSRFQFNRKVLKLE